MPWSTVQAELERSWEQGQHVTIAAPTGHGKTHLALALADLSRYVLVLATKRRDELVAGLQAHGWKIVGEYVDRGISGAKDRRPELDSFGGSRYSLYPHFS